MSKKAYVGVGGTPRNVKQIYVGVGGVPRKVVKGYVGVNGVPCVFWDGGSSPQIGSWDFWSSVSGLLFVAGNANVTKVSAKIAYYGAAWIGNWLTPILISPDSDAVKYNTYGSIHTSVGTLTDPNNITWYYSGVSGSINSEPQSQYMLNTQSTPYNTVGEAAQALLDLVYAEPFHEDYQGGQLYTFNKADVTKTLRKLLGVFLFKYIAQYSTFASYQALSDNADSIISDLVSAVGTDDVCVFSISLYNTGWLRLYAYHTTGSTSLRITSISQENGFKYFVLGQYQFASPNHYLDIRNGVVQTIQTSGSQSVNLVSGLQVRSLSNMFSGISNLGMDL